MSERTPLWLFGDQLGPHFHATGHNRDRPVLLIRSDAAFARSAFHRQKLHLLLTAMYGLADELGERATLIHAPSYTEGLRRYGQPVIVHEPHSRAAERLVRWLHNEGLVTEILPTPGFLVAKDNFEQWIGGRRRYLMEDFYRDQRRDFGVLLEPDGEPVGGKWNFDEHNRDAPPTSGLDVPRPYRPQEGKLDRWVRAELDSEAHAERIQPVGADGTRLFPASRSEARRALRRFLDERLPTFGPYQDAMLTGDPVLSHALLSVPLNLGLLDPYEVVRDAEQRYHDGHAPLASVEGFIRQILGWREWIWHLYWHLGPDYRRSNHLGAHRPLPRWWRELDTSGLTAKCLREALGGVRERGYAHHIQRLMVLGNHALQRGYDPAELTDWFATAFVDGYPWVMPANVIGMSQYADGGVVATKPYAAGGAYIDRMSDYCGGCAFDPKVRLGERACPFTAGYWAFLHRAADRLAGNHRMRLPLAGLRKLADREEVVAQEAHREQL